MTIITRTFAWIRSLFVHTISGAALGIVVHEDTEGDRARLAALSQPSRLPLVRTPNYGDPDSAQRILALSAAGYPLLVIVPFGKGYGPVGAGMTLQIDDEPDRQSPAVSPEQYGQTFRSTMEAMRHTLPSSIPIVTAGFSTSATENWIARALMAGASDADAVCFHVYGDDLVEAFTARLTAVTAAMAAAGCTKPLWITEIGYNAAGASPTRNPTAQAAQLKALLALPALRAVARVYIYALSTDVDADYYGICQHDLSRTPRAAFAVVQSAMGRS